MACIFNWSTDRFETRMAIDYKPHGRRTALLICVNLSQNSSKISFPGRSWKCRLSGSAASKQSSASQSYSQSETGNKAILKSRFQVEAGNALGAALPQVSKALPPNGIPSQRLGTRHHVLMLKISFPGRSWKCAWGGAASKQGSASQWYSQSLTGNKANNKKKTGNKAR
jgi:hypothetical protein